MAWALGLGLGALAACLYAPRAGLTPAVLSAPLFRAFAGIFLGGLNSMYGAVRRRPGDRRAGERRRELRLGQLPRHVRVHVHHPRPAGPAPGPVRHAHASNGSEGARWVLRSTSRSPPLLWPVAALGAHPRDGVRRDPALPGVLGRARRRSTRSSCCRSGCWPAGRASGRSAIPVSSRSAPTSPRTAARTAGPWSSCSSRALAGQRGDRRVPRLRRRAVLRAVHRVADAGVQPGVAGGHQPLDRRDRRRPGRAGVRSWTVCSGSAGAAAASVEAQYVAVGAAGLCLAFAVLAKGTGLRMRLVAAKSHPLVGAVGRASPRRRSRRSPSR